MAPSEDPSNPAGQPITTPPAKRRVSMAEMCATLAATTPPTRAPRVQQSPLLMTPSEMGIGTPSSLQLDGSNSRPGIPVACDMQASMGFFRGNEMARFRRLQDNAVIRARHLGICTPGFQFGDPPRRDDGLTDAEWMTIQECFFAMMEAEEMGAPLYPTEPPASSEPPMPLLTSRPAGYIMPPVAPVDTSATLPLVHSSSVESAVSSGSQETNSLFHTLRGDVQGLQHGESDTANPERNELNIARPTVAQPPLGDLAGEPADLDRRPQESTFNDGSQAIVGPSGSTGIEAFEMITTESTMAGSERLLDTWSGLISESEQAVPHDFPSASIGSKRHADGEDTDEAIAKRQACSPKVTGQITLLEVIAGPSTDSHQRAHDPPTLTSRQEIESQAANEPATDTESQPLVDMSHTSNIGLEAKEQALVATAEPAPTDIETEDGFVLIAALSPGYPQGGSMGRSVSSTPTLDDDDDDDDWAAAQAESA